MRIGLTFDQRSERSSGALTDDSDEEFDSPETIAAIAQALEQLGHEVELLGNGEPLLARLLAGPRPELVFNFAEGRGSTRSREAQVPAVLEMLGIGYTGSDPLTLSVTLDKDCGKRLVKAAGVATPAWVHVPASGELSAELRAELERFPLPAVVKPVHEGSSKGIHEKSLVANRAELWSSLETMRDLYRQPALVEEYIEGDDLTVGLVGNPPEVVGVMRVLPRNEEGPFLYSIEHKRDWQNRITYECPAQIGAADTRTVIEAARRCWDALSCRDVARVDFRLRDHVPYFLEVNPLPGLSPLSGDLVIMAGKMGLEHTALVEKILAAAVERLWPAKTRRGPLAAARSS